MDNLIDEMIMCKMLEPCLAESD